jgi:TetR/AcrR family transcriptional regulator, tetracycline repressor protein
MKSNSPRPLARDRIVALALDIADREGLAAVSFRRLAQELGVTPMALYHHVEDKADLLGGMTDRLLGEVETPAGAGLADWRVALRQLLRSFVSVRQRHACTADLLQRQPFRSAEAPRLTELTLRILHDAGFELAEALQVVQQLGTLLLVRPAPPPLVPPDPDPAAAAELKRRYPLLASLGKKGWRWNEPERDRDLGVELLILGVQGLLRRRR